MLMNFFLEQYAAREGGPPPRLTPDVIERLVAYDWPGNVRELRNVAERLLARCGRGNITVDALPAELTRRAFAGVRRPVFPPHR